MCGAEYLSDAIAPYVCLLCLNQFKDWCLNYGDNANGGRNACMIPSMIMHAWYCVCLLAGNKPTVAEVIEELTALWKPHHPHCTVEADDEQRLTNDGWGIVCILNLNLFLVFRHWHRWSTFPETHTANNVHVHVSTVISAWNACGLGRCMKCVWADVISVWNAWGLVRCHLCMKCMEIREMSFVHKMHGDWGDVISVWNACGLGDMPCMWLWRSN